jgi:CheY-like chemotaxis protein
MEMMTADKERFALMADDDADDRDMAERALRGTPLEGRLRFVNDGVQLLDFLARCAPADGGDQMPSPAFILLDLNMPRMNGYDVLRVLKGDEFLRRIPVVVLTASSADEDVVKTYDLGVNAFVTKPVRFEELRKVLSRVGEFWLEVASSPQL